LGLAPAWAGNLAAVPITMTPIYTNTAIGLGMIDAARRSSQRAYGTSATGGGTPAPPVAGTVSFEVPSDPAVSAEVKATYIDNIRANNPPQIAAAIAATFQRKPVRVAYLEAASPYGVADRDLRDVTAAYLTVAWMTANKAPRPTRSQVQGLRRQVADDLASRPASSDPRMRQVAAEGMMYQIVSTIYARQEAEKAGDAEALQRMADLTSAAFRKQDLDLRAVALTDRGFIPR